MLSSFSIADEVAYFRARPANLLTKSCNLTKTAVVEISRISEVLHVKIPLGITFLDLSFLDGSGIRQSSPHRRFLGENSAAGLN